MQLLHQQMIELALGFDLSEIVAQTVCVDMAKGADGIGIVRMLHTDVVQMAVGLHVARGVSVAGIISIQHIIRVDKAEALTGDVAQIGSGQIILQTSRHFVDVVRLVKAEGAHTIQVFLNLIQAEIPVLEPHLGQFGAKRSQQGVSAVVNTGNVNPHEGTAFLIVFPDPPDDGIGITVRHRKML